MKFVTPWVVQLYRGNPDTYLVVNLCIFLDAEIHDFMFFF